MNTFRFSNFFKLCQIILLIQKILWYNSIKQMFNCLMKGAHMAEIHLPHSHNDTTHRLLENMPDAEVFEKSSDTFALISDPTRLKILWLLCHTEECVANIAAAINMSSPAVSHHLRVLKQAGLLSYRRQGKEAYYTLADTDEAKLVHHIVDVLFDLNCENCY